MPSGEHLRLSDDKDFVMSEMKRSMRNNMEDTVWPAVQYLWKLHPLFSWVNDKIGLQFKRDEVPVCTSEKLPAGAVIFIVTGSIPNKKSTPLVDEWFGVLYQDGKFVKNVSMNDAVQMTELRSMKTPNPDKLTEELLTDASVLLPDVVEKARHYLKGFYTSYQNEINPMLDEEIDKLADLQEKHKDYQLSLFENERKRSEAERKVDDLFDRFVNWVNDTLTIQDNPYIRIISVVMGV